MLCPALSLVLFWYCVGPTPLHEKYATRAARHEGIDREQAEHDYREAIRLAPKNGTYRRSRALFFEKADRLREARLDMRKAIELESHTSIFLIFFREDLGELRKDLQRISEEIEQTEKQEKANPPKGILNDGIKPEPDTSNTPEKDAVLSVSAISRWRNILGAFPCWEPTHPFSQEARKLLGQLAPPFISEKEALIFHTGIWERGGPRNRIWRITYRNKPLREGFILATESRFILGHVKYNLDVQIPYSRIQIVYPDNPDYTLCLTKGDELVIHTKVPRRSLLGALAVMVKSYVGKATSLRLDREKAGRTQDFATIFSGFLLEIVDMNKSAQKGPNG